MKDRPYLCKDCDTSPYDCGWEIFVDCHTIENGRVVECDVQSKGDIREYYRVARERASTPYMIGRNFEYRVKKWLLDRGWFVMRSFASKGAADLFAYRNGAGVFIQCKYTSGKFNPESIQWLKEVEGLRELCRKHGGCAYFFYPDAETRHIAYSPVHNAGWSPREGGMDEIKFD